MRTETNQIEMIVIRFPVNQQQIRLDVAVSVICPITRERMIEVVSGQYLIGYKQAHNLHQGGIKCFSMPSRFFPFVVALEATDISNLPHLTS